MAIKTPSPTTVAELGGRFFARMIGRKQNFLLEIWFPLWNYNVEEGLVSEIRRADFSKLMSALSSLSRIPVVQAPQR